MRRPGLVAEVPVEHGHSGENPDLDVVEARIGWVDARLAAGG